MRAKLAYLLRRAATRLDPKPTTRFTAADGTPLSMWNLRAGAVITRTDYDHANRELVAAVAPDQTADIVAALTAAVNGNIGGRIALGFRDTPPGSVARY